MRRDLQTATDTVDAGPMTAPAPIALDQHLRAGRYSRGLYRKAQAAFLRRNWWRLVLVVLLPTVFMSTGALSLSSPFWQGAMSTAGLAAGLSVAGFLLLVHTGSGPQIAGDWAEQWSSEELRPLQDHGYRLANHVIVRGRGDADHILVGPGGVYLFETKWSATAWHPKHPRLVDAASRVKRQAGDLSRQVHQPVTPVLVLWGRAGEALDSPMSGRDRDGVKVFQGAGVQRWLLGRPRGVLSDAVVSDVFQVVSLLAVQGDARGEAPPLEIEAAVTRTLLAVGLGFATFTGLTLTATLGPAVFLVSAVGVLLGGLFLRRCQPLAGTSLATAGAVALLLVAGALVTTLLG